MASILQAGDDIEINLGIDVFIKATKLLDSAIAYLEKKTSAIPMRWESHLIFKY